MDQMLSEDLGDSAVFDALAHFHHEVAFGRSGPIQQLPQQEVNGYRFTGHLLWMGLLGFATPPLALCMSYLHHLALPPLERRLRSYARTMAFAEVIVSSMLQEFRRLRVAWGKEDKSKKDRVIWIVADAGDSTLSQLAREGYFEECSALKSDHETMTIFIVPGDRQSEEVSLPSGKHIKVVWISDPAYIPALPAPEMVFLFHFDCLNERHLRALAMCAPHIQEASDGCSAPLVLLTVRCEAEARQAKEICDILGLREAWPCEKTPPADQRAAMFARNVFSGMAGNPDMDFDDNGWMALIHGTTKDWLSSFVEDPNMLQSVCYFVEMNKKRVKWTDGLLGHAHATPGLMERLGDVKAGVEFTSEHMKLVQLFISNFTLTVWELLSSGLLEVITPEEIAAAEAEAKAHDAAAEQQPQEGVVAEVPREEPQEEEFRVVHQRVMVRAEPSTKSSAVGIYQQGALVRGFLEEVEGDKWLRIKQPRTAPAAQAKSAPASREAQEAWMLVDGHKLGLGTLLERTAPPQQETKDKEAQAAEKRDAAAKPQRSNRSPAVFWGILDLKYDSTKILEDQVKVLETGDGRLSRFSGYGATIKESFQQDHKLEETIRRAVLTENKKLTHDVIVDHSYGHVRPRQKEFRREYTPDLVDKIYEAFNFDEHDLCVLKLCNRARGAGVIPVKVSELDEVLQELLRPPSDLEAWFQRQPKDWAREVTWGCMEEQVRHWWTNECPCFLVEELCQSMSTEKEEKMYDGTMRVGFSLHREHRNKLPPGWVDSPDGPVKLRSLDGEDDLATDNTVPSPWNDPRPYLDLFRMETAFLRVQWLGGYWKLPIEDVNSQDLRGKIVSVAKQGTAPVSDADLHAVYSSLGDMVSLLFGPNDISQGALRTRYKPFPELGCFIIARMACSIRACDKQKSSQLMELARLYMDKEKGLCKDLVSSYIHRNLGVAEAGHNSQWLSAADHFRKSIQKMPANANSRHLLGLHYLEMGDPKKAAEILEEVLLLDPDFKAPYACLGLARLRMGQYKAAAAWSKAGLARHPYTPACQYNLGVASFAQAYLEEQKLGGGHIATDLRTQALEALEAARDQRFRDQVWEAKDDSMIMKLMAKDDPLVWPQKLPQDGWKVMGWRP